MDSKLIKDMAEQYTKAWCSKSPDQVASFFDQHGAIKVNNSTSHVGRDEISKMTQRFYDEFPDLVVRMDAFRSAGNNAVYFWTLEGTHAVTNNKIRIEGWEEWMLTDDVLIMRSTGHFDENEYKRQIEEGI